MEIICIGLVAISAYGGILPKSPFTDRQARARYIDRQAGASCIRWQAGAKFAGKFSNR